MKNIKKGKKFSMSHIHDTFVKHNFGSKEGMIAFLESHLSRRLLRKITLESVQMEGNEFLPNRYRNTRHADIILSVQQRKGNRLYLLVLLEAQSKHDKYMAARILEYHAAIAFAHLRRGNDKVPLIITFVLYHGKEPWTSAQSIAHLFKDFEDYVALGLKKNFLVHLKTEDIEKLAKKGKAAFPLIALALQVSGAYCENLNLLYPLMKKHGQDDQENIHYMASQNKHGSEAFFQKLSIFEPENAENYNNMYKLLTLKERMRAKREGKKEGREEGKKEGREEGKKEGREEGKREGKLEGREEERRALLKKLLQKEISLTILAEVTGLTPEALQKL